MEVELDAEHVQALVAAVDDLHQSTGRDLNLVVGLEAQRHVGWRYDEKIQRLRRSIGHANQKSQAPKSWIGSQELSLFYLIGDALDLIQKMNLQLAHNTHNS